MSMFTNINMHLELARQREHELAQQARHLEHLRAARAGRLQPEIRLARAQERRSLMTRLLRRSEPAF
ncbi:MAG: hypothetical protein ACXVY5_00435 [Gaiellales bacterium]